MDYSQYEIEIYTKLQLPGDPSQAAFMKNYMEDEKCPFIEKRKALRSQSRMAARRLQDSEGRA